MTALALLLLAACASTQTDDNEDTDDTNSSTEYPYEFEEQANYGLVCATPVPGGIEVEASSDDCAGDHDGATFACTVSADGSTLHIETVFQDGRDPDDGCAPPLETSCSASAPDGEYTVEFGSESYPLSIPSGGTVCLPGGGSSELGGTGY